MKRIHQTGPAIYQVLVLLLKVFLESIPNECLPPTHTQGLITLIPKPKKDTQLIDNKRPICLSNSDHRTLAIALAKQLKMVLDSMIDKSQSRTDHRFIRDRHISNNVRPISVPIGCIRHLTFGRGGVSLAVYSPTVYSPMREWS